MFRFTPYYNAIFLITSNGSVHGDGEEDDADELHVVGLEVLSNLLEILWDHTPVDRLFDFHHCKLVLKQCLESCKVPASH